MNIIEAWKQAKEGQRIKRRKWKGRLSNVKLSSPFEKGCWAGFLSMVEGIVSSDDFLYDDWEIVKERLPNLALGAIKKEMKMSEEYIFEIYASFELSHRFGFEVLVKAPNEEEALAKATKIVSADKFLVRRIVEESLWGRQG